MPTGTRIERTEDATKTLQLLSDEAGATILPLLIFVGLPAAYLCHQSHFSYTSGPL